MQSSKEHTLYVLGQLDESAMVALEDRYFFDDDVFEMLCAQEADLIDSYVGGTLPETEAQQFAELVVRSDALQGRIEFARSLLRIASFQVRGNSLMGRLRNWWGRY